MRTQLKPGDVVYLTGGGPTMTVVGVDADGSTTCQWFDDKKLCSEVFPSAALTKVDLDAPKPPLWSR